MKTLDDGNIVVESLFCPPHLELFKAGELNSINNCVACIAAQCGEMKRRETAWLIEKRCSDGSYYVTVDGPLTWTKDVYKALRLARREDADLLAELIDDAELTSEHEWGDYERDATARLADEVQRRMDAVAEAAVEWHESGQEGDDRWFDKSKVLSTAINSLLELRETPSSVTAKEQP